jgi:RNA polymerase sigma-70 factor, ECF subfamily
LEQDFIKVLKENQGYIHKVCYMYCNTREGRKDLFQEITLQLWKAYDTFQGKSKISTWIYRVALNTAISFIRKETKMPTFASEDVGFIAYNEKEDYENFERDEQVKILYQAINKLSTIEKTITFLYMEDYKINEIADMVGITPNNVSVKMMRIKEKLKNLVNV